MGKLGIRHAVAGLCMAGLSVAFEVSALAQQRPATPAAPAQPAPPAPPAAPAQPAPAQPAPAQPAPAPLPPLPASHLAAARAVMDISGVTANFDGVIGNVASQLLGLFVQKRPANAKDFEEILISLKPELEAKKKELLDKAIDAYARKLDEPTLRAVLVFMQTPAGMKYTAALPQILNEVADASDAWTRDIATYMGTRIVEEMKKRGVDLGR